MQCHDVDRILNDHVVSTLRRSERAAVDEHLRDCDRCAPLWQAHGLLTAGPIVTTPAGLFERVLEQADRAGVDPSPTVTPRTSPLQKLTVPLGIAAAAALVALLLFQPGPQDPDAPSIGGEIAAAAAATAGDDALPAGRATAAVREAIESGLTRFVEGTHYRVVASPDPVDTDADFIEIEEFFMYGCPHCYSFEGLFDPWCEIQPEYVNITRVPVVFNALAGMHARAFYTAELLDIDERIHGEMLAAIHDRGERLATESELAGFAAQFGVDESEYLGTFRSAEVTVRVEAAMNRAQKLGIRATPTVIVGGRYEISPGLTGSYEDMLELADQLVDELAAERGVAGGTACTTGDESAALRC